jgi:hypothetical protein
MLYFGAAEHPRDQNCPRGHTSPVAPCCFKTSECRLNQAMLGQVVVGESHPLLSQLHKLILWAESRRENQAAHGFTFCFYFIPELQHVDDLEALNCQRFMQLVGVWNTVLVVCANVSSFLPHAPVRRSCQSQLSCTSSMQFQILVQCKSPFAMSDALAAVWVCF